SLALYKTAQALAALAGRDYILPEDVRAMAPLCLPHRLILKPESQLRGRTARSVVDAIVREAALDIGERDDA
ncbi:MAG: AAA family ATPase, partial [Chloroflexia bacterium]|nr:AAA family ATPase [Chloroflexia bacterium]